MEQIQASQLATDAINSGLVTSIDAAIEKIAAEYGTVDTSPLHRELVTGRRIKDNGDTVKNQLLERLRDAKFRIEKENRKKEVDELFAPLMGEERVIVVFTNGYTVSGSPTYAAKESKFCVIANNMEIETVTASQ